ncbi:MAG: hypothetical protein PHY92_09130 [Alphaproteobacteria bacterium]|nr:hypothetical protein [Alphaproteobacteria bacterium]
MYVPYVARLPDFTFLGLYRGPFVDRDNLPHAAIVFGDQVVFQSIAGLQEYSRKYQFNIRNGDGSVFTELVFYEIRTAIDAIGKGPKNLADYPEASDFFDMPERGKVSVKSNFDFEPVRGRLALHFMAIMNQDHLVAPEQRMGVLNMKTHICGGSRGTGMLRSRRLAL